MIRKIAFTIGAALLSFTCLPAKGADAHALPTDFTYVAKTATPAVVSITVKEALRKETRKDHLRYYEDESAAGFWLGGLFEDLLPREPAMWQGSGFIVSSDGYILTNRHVIDKSQDIIVSLNDGREFIGTVIGQDSHTDIAVIKIEAANLPYLRLGNSDFLEVGQWVVAIGTPLGLQASLTVGVVSAKGRSNLDLTRIEDFIQTDAVLNRGNSGGPLLNLQSEVVGINTAIASSMGGYMGIGFAIPSKIAQRTMEQLIAKGSVSRGFIGIALQQMNGDLAAAFGLQKSQGIVAAEVVRGSPAEKAGLQAGDVIVKYNNLPVSTIGSFRSSIALMAPGSAVKLSILRDGKPRDVSVIVADESLRQAAGPSGSLHTETLGFTVESLTPAIAKALNLAEENGVIVAKIIPGSLADWAGLRTGTLILEVNKQKIDSAEQFKMALALADKACPILLLIKEKGAVKFLSLKID